MLLFRFINLIIHGYCSSQVESYNTNENLNQMQNTFNMFMSAYQTRGESYIQTQLVGAYVIYRGCLKNGTLANKKTLVLQDDKKVRRHFIIMKTYPNIYPLKPTFI